MSPFWILLELRMMEVMVTTGAIRRGKLRSNRHHQQTNIQLFTRWMPFLLPNQQCQSTEGKTYSWLVVKKMCNHILTPITRGSAHTRNATAHREWWHTFDCNASAPQDLQKYLPLIQRQFAVSKRFSSPWNVIFSLHYFETAGWGTGRASGL